MELCSHCNRIINSGSTVFIVRISISSFEQTDIIRPAQFSQWEEDDEEMDEFVAEEEQGDYELVLCEHCHEQFLNDALSDGCPEAIEANQKFLH